MKIEKKVKCNKCTIVITENGTCTCGNLILTNGVTVLKEGIMGIDAIDVSAKLLNE
jgi:hypothetical protein